MDFSFIFFTEIYNADIFCWNDSKPCLCCLFILSEGKHTNIEY